MRHYDSPIVFSILICLLRGQTFCAEEPNDFPRDRAAQFQGWIIDQNDSQSEIESPSPTGCRKRTSTSIKAITQRPDSAQRRYLRANQNGLIEQDLPLGNSRYNESNLSPFVDLVSALHDSGMRKDYFSAPSTIPIIPPAIPTPFNESTSTNVHVSPIHVPPFRPPKPREQEDTEGPIFRIINCSDPRRRILPYPLPTVDVMNYLRQDPTVILEAYRKRYRSKEAENGQFEPRKRAKLRPRGGDNDVSPLRSKILQ